MKNSLIKFSITLFLIVFVSFNGFAQNNDETRLIQITGLIVEQGDSLYGIPGAHIFNPNTGRGSTTNLMGYFSMAVMPGDSLLIASIGFMKQPYIVPEDSSNSYSVFFQLKNDTVILPEARVRHLPTERAFKEAFLALHLPEQDINNMNNNINRQLLINLYGTSDISPEVLARYNVQQQARLLEQQYVAQSITLLDPFAWSRFIRDVKEEKKKKEELEREEEINAPY